MWEGHHQSVFHLPPLSAERKLSSARLLVSGSARAATLLLAESTHFCKCTVMRTLSRWHSNMGQDYRITTNSIIVTTEHSTICRLSGNRRGLHYDFLFYGIMLSKTQAWYWLIQITTRFIDIAGQTILYPYGVELWLFSQTSPPMGIAQGPEWLEW